jgi:hypothetical protein
MADGVADGNPLQRVSFYRHRDAILDMFGIVIALFSLIPIYK